MQMQRCKFNPYLTLVRSCKRDIRQYHKCDVKKLLPKQPEKRRHYCNIFLTLYQGCCVFWGFDKKLKHENSLS